MKKVIFLLTIVGIFSLGIMSTLVANPLTNTISVFEGNESGVEQKVASLIVPVGVNKNAYLNTLNLESLPLSDNSAYIKAVDDVTGEDIYITSLALCPTCNKWYRVWHSCKGEKKKDKETSTTTSNN